MNKKSCHTDSLKQEILKYCEKDCCSNKTIKVESSDEAKKLQSLELFQKQITFLTAFVQVFFLEKADLSTIIIPHLNYVPPLRNKDIPMLFQSFLL